MSKLSNKLINHVIRNLRHLYWIYCHLKIWSAVCGFGIIILLGSSKSFQLAGFYIPGGIDLGMLLKSIIRLLFIFSFNPDWQGGGWFLLWPTALQHIYISSWQPRMLTTSKPFYYIRAACWVPPMRAKDLFKYSFSMKSEKLSEGKCVHFMNKMATKILSFQG